MNKGQENLTVASQQQETQKRRTKWRRSKASYICCTCGRELPFCWHCPCGFMICWDCMEENFWGMSCNGISWTCPDCGAIRNFGNA